MRKLLTVAIALLLSFSVFGQEKEDKFRQLYEELPTPNVYRTASGAPGHEYWQQRADHKMSIILDDDEQKITGSQTITYYNNSPDPLDYLWLQLDQNIWQQDSDANLIRQISVQERMNMFNLSALLNDFDGGFHIT